VNSADRLRQIASEAWEAAQRAPHGHGDEPHVEAIAAVLHGNLLVQQALTPFPPDTIARYVAAMERVAATTPVDTGPSEEDKAKEEEARVAQAERMRGAQALHIRSVESNERVAAALERIAEVLAERVPRP